MKKQSLISILLIVLTASCGFKVVNRSDANNFVVTEIITSGEKRINYKIKKKDLDKFYFSFKIKNLVGIFQCPNWMKIGNSRGGTIKSLNKKNVRTSPCVKPFREFTIYYDGSVTPCCDIYHGNNYSKYIVKKLSSKDKNEIFKVYAGKTLSLWRKDLFTWSEKKDICGSCSAPDLAERKDQKKRKKILSINNLKI